MSTLLTYFSWNGRFFHHLIIWTALLGWHFDLWNFIVCSIVRWPLTVRSMVVLKGFLGYYVSNGIIYNLQLLWLLLVCHHSGSSLWPFKSTKLVFFSHSWRAFAATWWLYWWHIVRVSRYIWFLFQNEMVRANSITISRLPGRTILFLTRNKGQPSSMTILV